jgi:predicted HicB family RNase H-like nuclease
MSDVDLKKLSRWIGKAKQIGEPPTLQSAAKRAHHAGGRDALVQFNVKVAASVKKRAKQLAARDDIQLGTLVERMLDLYEKEYGALGGTTAKHR